MHVRLLALLGALPLLAACENSAVPFAIDANREALILVREQPYFWSDRLEQAVVASRMPQCQRRVTIKPGSKASLKMEVFEAGSQLWALHQGNNWYLASTEKCLVQDWAAPAQPPGPLVGTFTLKDGVPAFVPVQAAPSKP
ncbi:MAG: hypothetical protein JNM61_04300 [Zoogloeaceae bacterium]|nr:hypothetical protein [Zoogloeaceae bacterium]